MKLAVIYASKHGTTEKVATYIFEKLKEKSEVEIFSLTINPNPDISKFDVIILGTPVYAGKPNKKMTSFCQKNISGLLEKKINLFVCGMDPNKEKQEKELNEAFPELLYQKATVKEFLGGEFLFEKMNFIERFIIKKIAKTNQSVSRINWKGVDVFVKKVV